MAVTLVALDFSRPVQPLFEQASRVGIVHSVFPKALNIVVADTLFVLLSVEAPRMPNSARLPAYVMEQLYGKLSPGMEVCIGDGRLSIPTLDLSIRLPRGAAWEPVPVIAARSWCRATVDPAGQAAPFTSSRERDAPGKDRSATAAFANGCQPPTGYAGR